MQVVQANCALWYKPCADEICLLQVVVAPAFLTVAYLFVQG